MPDFPSQVALERIQKQLDQIASAVMADQKEDMGENEGGDEGEMEGMGEDCCPTCGKPK